MIRIKPSKRNTNKHTEKGMRLLGNSIDEVGVIESISVTKQGTIISGHARKEKFDEKGLVPKEITLADNEYPVIVRNDIEDDTDTYYKAQILANTTAHQNYNIDLEEVEAVAEEYGFELEELGIEIEEKESDTSEMGGGEIKKGTLLEKFIVPPFSVLDTRQGYWQDRKRWWLSLGIKSEKGRDNVMETLQSVNKIQGNEMPLSSIFDPVLCELSYQWFNIPKGKILDPFAGGSVRGIVAAKLGFEYLGNDLRDEQITANRENAIEVLQDNELFPTWTTGDSKNIDKIAKGYEADMIFSCPPYADLEVYSDNPNDISNMEYKDFLTIYKEIIRKSCEMLKEDRFAVFVVGDVRDKKGFYRNFVSDTIMAFWNCGVILYNEMILVNAVGSLPIRAGKQFNASRKIGKTHQNVLVFYKGDPKKIKDNYPELDLSYIQHEEEQYE
nr:MAG TPA: putative modification methylase [Caudoviricetes sp.]